MAGQKYTSCERRIWALQFRRTACAAARQVRLQRGQVAYVGPPAGDVGDVGARLRAYAGSARVVTPQVRAHTTCVADLHSSRSAWAS